LEIGKIGKKVGIVPVRINYRIIELFSAGLYSSSNKAFEELVCNSFDADATKVAIHISTDKQTNEDYIWVCDNGESMNKDGLLLLWKIGFSNKRETDKTKLNRLPIGKFGIGKLATYILTKNLTYICKTNDIYRIVSMDFEQINKKSEKEEELQLDMLELTEDQIKQILHPLIQKNGKKLVDFDLWGKKSVDSWTFVLLNDLKPKAYEIQIGRLEWLLRTALPLNPDFNIVLNGKKIKSSKEDIKPLNTWIIGDNDIIASEMDNCDVGVYKNHPTINFPNLRSVHGKFELYRDSLAKGKSTDVGRSYGLFVIIRERLVNLDDPLFGLPEMYHGVFNRLRIEIHADELDESLTSTRESVKDTSELEHLHNYIKKKFNQIRSFFENFLQNEEKENSAHQKISQTSYFLSRRPILVMARKYFNNEIDQPLLTIMPESLTTVQQNELLSNLEKEVVEEDGIIKQIEWVALDPDDPLARFDIFERKAQINLLHPFFSNFSSEVRSTLPFQLIATVEILTEAIMIEKGIDQILVNRILHYRDQLLREMTYTDNPNAPTVAQMISDSLSNSEGLENALFHAFRRLGFETTKIGGKGKPDGKAEALLGVREQGGNKQDYSLVYDAKSTGKEKIQAKTASISAINRHKDDYNANFAVVVAVDFADSMKPDSAVNKEAKKNKVTLIRAKDLWSLVMYAIPKQVNFLELKDFFENNFTVPETSSWIKKIIARKIEKKPIKEILYTIHSLMNDIEPPHINAIRIKSEILGKYTVEQLKTLLISLENLVPQFIDIDSYGYISLNAHPDRIYEVINNVIENQIPTDLEKLYYDVFSNEISD